jgi:glycosyltransferase involved in cell wall biosynthesis
MATPNLVVFSHLRWGFVHQRPQHLLTRLAGKWRVFYIEEPVQCSGPAFVEVQHHGLHLTVLVPHTPINMPGFHDDQLTVLEPLILNWLLQAQVVDPVVWLYTPLALPLAQALKPSCLVYDCMDELSAFKDVSRQLRQRESALMRQAALVFTGGPSLYEAKRHLHPNAHCLPGSVDARHFSPSNLQVGSPAQLAVQALQGDLTKPRLGFYGVIDERLDLLLVAQLADQHPEWQLVMVGPVVKIDPSSLPQRPNIHWLGIQAYERLPHFLAGWDVCLMPFALTEATRFISPTKTLEYMAAEKPVVSTAVKDVVWLYGHAVEVAISPQAFIEACERVLSEDLKARCERAQEMLTTVSTSSWERSALSVHRLMSEARFEAVLACQIQHSSQHLVDSSPKFDQIFDQPKKIAAGGARA